ncbi:hypothetical protein QVD17_33328 [Tagetes erecta]|uniref:Uncharacterized protein n=1 Tax=Tagetes erecta TaxID=13708 RepID=A0AAD8K0T6_TARER|nr:hypothetical protein QVD17_33328 [Tagetes erecta]
MTLIINAEWLTCLLNFVFSKLHSYFSYVLVRMLWLYQILITDFVAFENQRIGLANGGRDNGPTGVIEGNGTSSNGRYHKK